MVLQASEGLSIAQAIKFAFVASNNEAEYQAVLLGLRLAKELLVTNLELRSDLLLVASQLRGEYEAKKWMNEAISKAGLVPDCWIHKIHSGSSPEIRKPNGRCPCQLNVQCTVPLPRGVEYYGSFIDS